ncbi:hypothetical protein [Kutzneria sp. CA-103260]|uniref:hypothetical protein n=1 Tax=Kutzneria sp. CA-103260 TaxID=2802641 RepID=UPI001BA86713|nr:hypothetical protein [Kutzneria sp. CA-103260]QUQ71020.1 hypothetical protein JJ691_88030 [Kutzneria sp. CA-103260]
MSAVDDGMRRAVLRRLAALDQAAEQTSAGTLAPLARAELQRLADGWRLLLEVHTADEDGRCRACPGRLRKRRWPCKVWLLAHQHLIGEGTPPPRPSGGGMRSLFRRGGRHSKQADGTAVQGVRTRPLPTAARPTMALPPEVPSEMTVEFPVLPALPPAPVYAAVEPPPTMPPAIASSGPFATVHIVDDPTWPAPGEYADQPDAPALARLDPIVAFGGVLPALPAAPEPDPTAPLVDETLVDETLVDKTVVDGPVVDETLVDAVVPPRFELLGEPDAETEEMRRVLEDYWQESPATK